MMGKKGTCLYCGNKFVASSARKKFCSRQCYFASRGKKISRRCKSCNKEFNVYPSDIKSGGGKYCSSKCYFDSISSKVKRKCLICQKEIFTSPTRIKEGRGKYCSRECQHQSLKTKIERQCKECGASFDVPLQKIRLGYGKYCSIKCRDKNRQNRKTGKAINCLHCGKEFYAQKNRIRAGIKYCSMKCSGLGKKQPWVIKYCVICKKEIPRSTGGQKRHSQRRYCSRQCRGKDKRNGVHLNCVTCGKEFYVSQCYFNNNRDPQHCSISCAKMGVKPWNTGLTKETDVRLAKMSETFIAKWDDPKFAEKMFKALRIRPTRPEVLFNEITPDIVKYTGDGTWWRTLPSGKHKNPDFIISGQSKTIEIFGDFWHKDDNPQDLIDLYKQINIDCLVIWEHEIYQQPDHVLEKVIDFL